MLNLCLLSCFVALLRVASTFSKSGPSVSNGKPLIKAKADWCSASLNEKVGLCKMCFSVLVQNGREGSS